MDDLSIFSKTKEEHFKHIARVLGILKKYGLNISIKSARFFVQEAEFLGYSIYLIDGFPCIKDMKSKVDAIQKLPLPKTKHQTHGLIGLCNYLSIFAPELQNYLRVMYKTTRKNNKFNWGKDQQEDLEKVKEILQNLPVLHMPRRKGLLRLYTDTSTFSTGSSLWQVIDGKECLLAFHPRKLNPTAVKYSVSELECSRLLINMLAFKHILSSVIFEAFVDHSALVQIIKSKNEPPIRRLKKLVEKLSTFSFSLGYVKGKSLLITDYLHQIMIMKTRIGLCQSHLVQQVVSYWNV